MKIRDGFVSNSSSTSFMIYGVALDDSEVEELFKAKYPEEYEEMGNDFDRYDAVETMTKGTILEAHHNYDYGTTWIGESMDAIGDDETKNQFKARIEDAIEKALGKKLPCGVHAESWYDG